jgi:hypothetical protein
MKRRTLLQRAAAVLAMVPIDRIRVFAQPRELTPDAVAMLHLVAATVLPASIGAARIGQVSEKFVAWTRGYREGVALSHGYGHPRLVKSGASPVPGYVRQLAALEAEALRHSSGQALRHSSGQARARGGRWETLDLETRRAILDAAFAQAGVRSLPPRPAGQHVVADLMAFYFRSSDANDLAYNALINREVCRPIAITTRKPEPLTR